MSITSYDTVSITPRKDGLLRVVLRFNFSDGRTLNRRHSRVAHVDDIPGHAVALQASALRQMQRKDAEDAIAMDINTAFNEASSDDIIIARMWQGYYEPANTVAYRWMSPVAPDLFVPGNNDVKLGNRFGVERVEMQRMRNKWNDLLAIEAAIQTYILAEDA